MLNPLRLFLAFLGRHATIAYALSMFVGLALPALAATLRPMIPISIFIFIVLSFARANLPGLKAVLQRPGHLALGLALSTLLPPLIGWIVLQALPGLDPALRLGIALMAAAPPLMASPVYASVVGLENSFALSMLVLGMVVAPLVSPALASFLVGAEVPISPLALAQRLAIFIGGGILAGLAVRRLVGLPRITALKNELDGMGVVLYFLFAVAAMDGVIDATVNRPALVAGIIAGSTLFCILGFATAYAMTGLLGFNDRFSIAISIGLRNMGLLVAPIISLVPGDTFLYFALAQVPVYMAPMMLKWAKARLDPRPAAPRPDPA
ncbi:MAG: bile acid:sodium symporter family protein [Rhabdaerophilum sp.]